ncbi:hypothetical protein CCICO_02525 [Corynebacterium ciconiae DSM 44920]|uniref:hypothetical protein n=1 Tax=Corynebacterium ciconiae TaxID=227319 RepID=UPI0003783E16|nr:hypothetical protein [Corynebacterium ciconiae]WKD60555.1 hypothetical protein CCICO_02525 [Corynebacterium ciconiae DSM 44920]
MSISKHFDDYLAEHQLIPAAEVVPDHPCQDFSHNKHVVDSSTPAQSCDDAAASGAADAPASYCSSAEKPSENDALDEAARLAQAMLGANGSSS